jgi:hypothetical protein
VRGKRSEAKKKKRKEICWRLEAKKGQGKGVLV